MKKQQVCGRWYERKVEPVIENDICDIVKMLWDVCIQVDRKIEHRKLHIVVMKKTTSKCLITGVACPVSNNLILKRHKKLDNYSEIQLEVAVQRQRNVNTGTLRFISNELKYYLEKLAITQNVGTLQKSVLLGTAKILRKVKQ